MTHPLSSHLKLSHLLATLPRVVERQESPPYLHTLALFESLVHLGFEARLWNAKLESHRRITIVAGVRMNGEILDWHGVDPRLYPDHYPLFQGGTFYQAGEEDLIPGKRQMAFQTLPLVIEMVNQTIDYLWLTHTTQSSSGESGARRL